MRELFTMSWEDVAGLAAGGGVAVLPVGAIEAHGPHLPLGTDVIIAEAMSRAGADRLKSRGYAPVVLPPLSYTAAPFAAAFPGTISLSPETVARSLTEIAAALSEHGFIALVIANAHLDPAHIGALNDGVREIANQGGIVPVFPDVTRRRWAGLLTDEFRSGACHAGRYETSIVLAVAPQLVREETRSGLPPVDRSLSIAIRDGFRTFHEAGGELAYFGAPAEASAEEGRKSIEMLGQILEQAVLEALEGG